MQKSLMMMVAVPATVAILAIVGAAPIGAQTPTTEPATEVAVLTVTKTVVGTAPAGTEFTLHISCVGSEEAPEVPQVADYDEDMTFGATGGNKEFVFTGGSECDITETDDGGANSSSGPVSVSIEQPIPYAAEIVNTFDPAAPTTTTAPAAAAAAVVTPAAFTG